jgi:hypothetical protein
MPLVSQQRSYELDERIGDAAGEHLQMRRGRYDAWLHVILGFAMQVGAIALLLGALGSLVLPQQVAFIIGAAIGLPIAIVVFRDRWRCIEAFASRFCAGLANISILYVPAIALVYANVRAVQKLSGR